MNIVTFIIKHYGYRAQKLRSRKADGIVFHNFKIACVPQGIEIAHVKQNTLFYGKSVVCAKDILLLCIITERFHNYQRHITPPKVVRARKAADLQCACTKK